MRLHRRMLPSGVFGALCVGAFSLGLAAQVAPTAATAATEKVAIINVEAAIRGTAEGRQAAAAIRTEFAPRQNDLKSQQQSLQALEQQLKDGGNTLSIGAKDELEQRIANKQKQIQRAYQDAQSDLQSAETDAVNRIGQKMIKVISSYATEHGYALVLDVSNSSTPVLFAAKGIDITAPIVALYNHDYPVTAASGSHKTAQP
ncbi:MAG: OmpH family outer membrane protein [Terriglobales bacterium]